MGKHGKNLDSQQLSLFAGTFEARQAPMETFANLEEQLRAEIAAWVRQSQKSRAGIATEMTELLQRWNSDPRRQISEHQLNAWTGQSRSPWRIPLDAAVAFAVATGGWMILDLYLRAAGRRLARLDEGRLAQLGEMETELIQMKKRAESIRSLKRKLA